MREIGPQINLRDLYTTQIVSANHKPDGTPIKNEYATQDLGISNHTNSDVVGRAILQMPFISPGDERVTLLAKESISLNPNGDLTLTKVERNNTRIDFDMVMPAAILARVENHINALREQHDIPGLVFSISTSRGAVTICSGVMNHETKQPVDENTQFMLASVTKTYTATMIMQMVQEGKLSLDDKLTDQKILGPELSELFSQIPDAEKITIAHLLQHTSGLPDPDFANNYLSEPTKGEWNSYDVVKMLEGAKLVSEPGSSYAYNNTGYSILGEILKHIYAKDSITEVFQDRIASKIGLENTQFGLIDSQNLASAYVEKEALPSDTTAGLALTTLAIESGKHEYKVDTGCTRFENTELHRRNHLLPEGGLVSSLADMQKFMRAFFESEKLLSKDHRDLMQGNGSIELKAAEYPNADGQLEYYRHYGLGLNVEHSPEQIALDARVAKPVDNGIPLETRNIMGTAIGHSGTLPGYQTDLKYYPEHGVGICIASNLGKFNSKNASDEIKDTSLDVLLKAKLFSDPEIADFLFKVKS